MRDADAEMVLTHPNYAGLITRGASILDIPDANYIIAGDAAAEGYTTYADFTSGQPDATFPDIGLADDDVYNIIYSSGTTGDPKGIVQDHYIRANYCTMFSQGFRFTPESIVLHTGAAIFNGAFVTLMPIFYNGGTLHPARDVRHRACHRHHPRRKSDAHHDGAGADHPVDQPSGRHA